MQISTERLVLRFIELSDLEPVHELHSLPETDQFNALGIPEDISVTRSIIESWIAATKLPEIENYTFVIEHKSNKAFIGLFGLKLGTKKYQRGEVWFKIHKNHWKRGYATEALKAVIRFGFETLHLHRIEAGCAVDNIGSISVLEKAGMIREGRARKILPLKSGWADNFGYSILETDKRP